MLERDDKNPPLGGTLLLRDTLPLEGRMKLRRLFRVNLFSLRIQVPFSFDDVPLEVTFLRIHGEIPRYAAEAVGFTMKFAFPQIGRLM